MRTTLTIDPDNAERLRKLAHRSRLPFKRVLNDALRLGLRGKTLGEAEPPFVVKASPMRLKAGVDPMRLSQFEADLDVAAFEKKTKRPGTARATPHRNHL
jgi:hypothetical protein